MALEKAVHGPISPTGCLIGHHDDMHPLGGLKPTSEVGHARVVGSNLHQRVGAVGSRQHKDFLTAVGGNGVQVNLLSR